MEEVIRTGRKQRSGNLVRNALIFIVLGAGFRARLASQAPEQSLEYQVKAAFLLNFTKFIDWPPTAFAETDSPMSICILGKDPFGRVLDDIVQGEVVKSRKVNVQRLSQSPAPKSCQVVFIDSAEKDLPKTLNSLGHGVLTVGEGEKFIREGGMVAFVIEDRHVRFHINQTVALNAELRLSSKLLRVARSVEK
jgi:YfiR/HmsC-like